MNDMSAAISAALPLLEALFSLGVPGVLLMLASIPALVIAVIFILDYKHGKRVSRVLEAYRLMRFNLFGMILNFVPK